MMYTKIHFNLGSSLNRSPSLILRFLITSSPKLFYLHSTPLSSLLITISPFKTVIFFNEFLNFQPLTMLLRCVILSVLCIAATSFVLPVVDNLADCAAPNGTDKVMHWWQCSSGPVQFLNATPYDSTGKQYEYPIHLSQPIVVKTQINNPTSTYVSPNLRNTVNIWKYGGWNGCTWSSIPTLGLL